MSEQRRPAWHFTPPAGWLNDPHGVHARDGGYEAFFQYVGGQTTWDVRCAWGRASGPDLVSLRFDGVALAPGDGDDGIWTGCLVEATDGDRIFYTSVREPDLDLGRVRVARRVGAQWEKGDVVIEPPDGVTVFRDPFVARDGGGWLMIVGARLVDGRAAMMRYTSTDLEAWSYEGVALARGSGEMPPTGDMWECPQLVDVGAATALLVAAWRGGELLDIVATVGSWDGPRFQAGDWRQLTYGGVHYAPSAFIDDAGRPSVIFWLRGVADEPAGWAGALSAPYLVTGGGHGARLDLHPDVRATRRLDAGETTVPAIVRWTAPEDGTLRLIGRPTVELRRRDGELAIVTGSSATRIPCQSDDITIVVDHGVIEVLADGALAGVVTTVTRIEGDSGVEAFGPDWRSEEATRR